MCAFPDLSCDSHKRIACLQAHSTISVINAVALLSAPAYTRLISDICACRQPRAWALPSEACPSMLVVEPPTHTPSLMPSLQPGASSTGQPQQSL